MKNKRLTIDIVPQTIFVKEDGTFDLEKALELGGKFAGICYDKEGFDHLANEPVEKTNKRIVNTMAGGHHSVYGHTYVTLNIKFLPKILAMVINNENEYNTSEKSGRYTPINTECSPIITEEEEKLYNKWLEIFFDKIKKRYGDIYNDNKIKKLAQENARYLVTVFYDTQMVYTTSLRQINYLASWMEKYINGHDKNNDFESKLSMSMKEFINELKKLNLLDERLMKNDKNRSLSLFSKRYDDKKEIYSDVYLTKYIGSFAQLAQSQRHRTLDYEIRIPEQISFYVPPILEDDANLVKEWLDDINSLKDVYPNGMLIDIIEMGSYENFILKCKERLCSAAQLEIMLQTKETLEKYKGALKEQNHPLYNDIEKYSKGARCTFPDYTCPMPCKFKEGIKLVRKI